MDYEAALSRPSYKQHETFFLEDVYFVFDDTIFKFPKLYLSQTSPVLQQLFTKTSAERDAQDDAFTGNGTMANPYSCNTVKKAAFVQLLRLLGPMILYQTPTLTTGEWKNVLGLSSQWQMDPVVEMSISHLQDMKLDATTKLELAKKHNIQNKEWRLSAVREFVDKDIRLTEADAYRIGIDVALKIARVQGMVRDIRQTAAFGSAFGARAPSSGFGAFGQSSVTSVPTSPAYKQYIQVEFPDLYTQ